MSSYHDALLQTARAYADAVATHGGKSLSRVATIVVNRGSFFERLQQDVSFSVRNLERFAEWFRKADNWPHRTIPASAIDALNSMGRPPISTQEQHSVTDCALKNGAADVRCDRRPTLQPAHRA